jgi:hypothetical protein
VRVLSLFPSPSLWLSLSLALSLSHTCKGIIKSTAGRQGPLPGTMRRDDARAARGIRSGSESGDRREKGPIADWPFAKPHRIE